MGGVGVHSWGGHVSMVPGSPPLREVWLGFGTALSSVRFLVRVQGGV